MNPAQLILQPTIHLQSKPGYGRREYPGLLCKCIVGCIFNSVGLIDQYPSRNTLHILHIFYKDPIKKNLFFNNHDIPYD
jgi:hypothetical protein